MQQHTASWFTEDFATEPRVKRPAGINLPSVPDLGYVGRKVERSTRETREMRYNWQLLTSQMYRMRHEELCPAIDAGIARVLSRAWTRLAGLPARLIRHNSSLDSMEPDNNVY